MKIDNALVANIESNKGSGKGALRTFYTVHLDNKGSTLKVDWNPASLPTVGEHISCEISDTMSFGKYKLLSRGGSASSGAPSAGTRSSGGRPDSGFPIPSDSMQQSIIRQNSLGHAINLIAYYPEVFLGNDMSTRTPDMVVKKVVEVAFYLAEFSSGKLEVDVTSSLAEKLRSV